MLIDHAPRLLSAFTKSPIPLLKPITEFIVRRTFFAQFVPGETVQECSVTMKDLRKNYGIGSVLNYSAEADLEPGEVMPEKERRDFEEKRLKEVENALKISGKFEDEVEKELNGMKGSTSFALKVVSETISHVSGLDPA
jgi:proline dehydrogenase